MPFSDVYGSDAAFRVCVDQVSPGRAISGRVLSRRLTAPIDFADLGELLLRLDQVLETQGVPQAFQRSRTFGSAAGDEAPCAAGPEEGMDAAAVDAAVGEKLTFTVNITARRNSTWQGVVNWLDGSPRQEFESALEFLKLAQDRILA